jgi:hypothetical protein
MVMMMVLLVSCYCCCDLCIDRELMVDSLLIDDQSSQEVAGKSIVLNRHCNVLFFIMRLMTLLYST